MKIFGKSQSGGILLVDDKIVLQNCYFIPEPPEKGFLADLVLSNGKISDILPPNKKKNINGFDLKEAFVCPGFIDIHTHLREPGQIHKEDIYTGSLAAVSGGVTTIFAMPNTYPVIDNVKKIRSLKKVITKKAICNVLPVGAATIGLKGKKIVNIRNMSEEGIKVISDDGYPIPVHLLEEILERAAKYNIKVIQHPENEKKAGQGSILSGYWSDYFKVKGIDPESESECILSNLEIVKKSGFPIHFTHLSSIKSLKYIARAKKKNIPITVDVTPHHLALTSNRLKKAGSDAVMSPPLRSKKDNIAVKKSIIQGIVDIVASDHAPHSFDEKNKPMNEVPKGVIGLQTMFGILTKYLGDVLTVEQIISLITSKPADIFSLHAGRLKIGSPADLVIFKKKKWKVKKDKLLGKSKNTPFENFIFPYKVMATFVNGKIVFHLNEFKDYFKT